MLNAKGQKFYEIDSQLKVEIDVYLTREKSYPSIAECRYAALQLKNKGDGYVVYDRLLCRIVNGVFYSEGALEAALGVAAIYNEGRGNPDMCPNGVALGLVYPKGRDDD